MKKVEILDTTLRDGAQSEGISFSVRDKLAIVETLDALGIPLVEAGNPGSNPKDLEFFQEVRSLRLKHARLAAFGATRRPGTAVADDPQVRSLVEAGTKVLVHIDTAVRVLDEEEAGSIDRALEGLAAALEGRAFEHLFQDLIDREPELPAHLRG